MKLVKCSFGLRFPISVLDSVSNFPADFAFSPYCVSDSASDLGFNSDFTVSDFVLDFRLSFKFHITMQISWYYNLLTSKLSNLYCQPLRLSLNAYYSIYRGNAHSTLRFH